MTDDVYEGAARELAPPRIPDPYAFSDEALEFVPTIVDIAAAENRVRWTGGLGNRRERSEDAIDTAIADRIKLNEQAIITDRYLQRIRAERTRDEGWLRKLLGITKGRRR